MSEEEVQELDLDLWEGQFRFVGGYSQSKNGVKRAAAAEWCEGIAEQVQLLQQQVSALADNQTNTDDRYSRAKQENAALQARVHMLEEQLREVELRAEERLQEEQKRHKELMVRVEREKQLELENYAIRLQTLEKEGVSCHEEIQKLRVQVERLRHEKNVVEEQLGEVESTLASLREEHTKMQEMGRREKAEITQERTANSQLVEELSQEVERLKENGASRARSPSSLELPSRLSELQSELKTLRDENKNLKETNEELQAQILNRSLEAGRDLLTGIGNNSLAAEFEAMSQDELEASSEEQKSIGKMRSALKEQKEVNVHLRSYIDGILLNIVENYPQLLEKK